MLRFPLLLFSMAAAAVMPALAELLPLPDRPVFPADNAWNMDISKEPPDPSSETILRSIGMDKPLHPDFGTTAGIPYVVVAGSQPKVPVKFDYPDESDPGPYPVPADAPIEGGTDAKGDRHILIVDRDNWMLYELFSSFPPDGKRGWKAGSGAIFDLASPKPRPQGWTSADAAGLPIFPGLVRYDEAVVRGVIPHALRFTCVRTRRAYVAPATHFASRLQDVNLPPMGMRVRLKAGFDGSAFPKSVQPILTCLKTYGMLLADNGGDFFITGAPDPRWNNDELHFLKKVKGSDLEVVKMGELITR